MGCWDARSSHAARLTPPYTHRTILGRGAESALTNGQPLAVHEWDSVISQPQAAVGLAAAVCPAGEAVQRSTRLRGGCVMLNLARYAAMSVRGGLLLLG